MNTREVPPGVRQILEAMSDRAISLCARRGIDLADFYAVLREQQVTGPCSTVRALYRRTFLRFGVYYK